MLRNRIQPTFSQVNGLSRTLKHSDTISNYMKSPEDLLWIQPISTSPSSPFKQDSSSLHFHSPNLSRPQPAASSPTPPHASLRLRPPQPPPAPVPAPCGLSSGAPPQSSAETMEIKQNHRAPVASTSLLLVATPFATSSHTLVTSSESPRLDVLWNRSGICIPSAYHQIQTHVHVQNLLDMTLRNL